MEPETNFDPGFFDREATRKWLWRLLWGLCGLSLVLEPLVHREPHFDYEGFFGFYALLGFIACAACILVAKGLGLFLKKRECYYDDDAC